MHALEEAVAKGDVVQSNNSYRLGVGAAALTGAAKKRALEDSTKHNAAKKTNTGRRGKAKESAARKPAAASKKAPVATANDFDHDDHYMKLLQDGFPKPGAVSPCHHYYICQENDTYLRIAEKVGLDDWNLLNEIEFNARFYGLLSITRQLKKETIIKLPVAYCSKWQLSKLVDSHAEKVQAMATCVKCHRKGTLDCCLLHFLEIPDCCH